MAGPRSGRPSVGWLPTLLTFGVMAVLAGVAGATRGDGDAPAASPKPGPARVSSPAKDAEPVWRTDFKKAREIAAKQKKPILLRFTAEWCPPCQVMNRSVFPREAVQKALADRVVPVLVDIDEQKNEELAPRYKVRGIPALVLIDADGEVLDRGGFMSAEALLEFLPEA